MDLKNKVVVITGANKGLGKALVLQFVAKGADIVGTTLLDTETKNLERETGAKYVVCDITDKSAVHALADFSIKSFGRIDVWVNNAGIWLPHPAVPVAEADVADMKKMMDVNLYGLAYGAQVALLQMRSQKSGAIINIISTSGLEGRNGSAGYCASKFAADGFTKAMRAELVANNEPIFLINIYPGGMKTDLFNGKIPANYETYMMPENVAEKIVGNLAKEVPDLDLIIRRPK